MVGTEPRLAGAENKIKMTPEDHMYAHGLLYAVYGNWEDGCLHGRHRPCRCGVCCLSSHYTEAVHQSKIKGAEAVHAIQKAKKATLWDPEYQKKHHDQLNLDKVFRAPDKYIWSFNGKEVFCSVFCRLTYEVRDTMKQYDPEPPTRLSIVVSGKYKQTHGWSCVQKKET